jgi:YHS domain-containing protein
MKMMLKTHLAAGVLAALGAFVGCDRAPSAQPPVQSTAPSPATQPATQPVAAIAVNKFCPVMPEDPIDPKVTFVHAGKAYAFCCESCIDDFKKDPEKFAKAAK